MNLKEFISHHLNTVDQLRLLLHLKATPRTEWDMLDVAAKLYMTQSNAVRGLEGLVTTGLAVATGNPVRFRYQPRTNELADLVEKLAEMDRTQPVTLINMIYTHSKEIEAFADAFQLRKEPGH